MYKHPIRKSFGLFVLYSIIIIGIFVLQFRNESVVSKNTGLLSISLAQSQSQEGNISLKNSLQVSFKGISFTADEVTPATLTLQSEHGPSSENLSLLSYEQRTPLSYTFTFTHDVELTFAVSGIDSSAALTITASLPEGASGLHLHYKPSSGFSVTEKTRSKLILNSRNLTYAFTAAQISDKDIFLSSANSTSYYVAYDASVVFSFISLDSDIIISKKSTYESNIRDFKENLINSVESALNSSQSLSEKSIIAYVAEMASQGRYAAAIKNIPDSFKKGNKRTYLSAPYFDTLEAMYPSLEMHNSNMNEMIENALSTHSLSIFSVDGLAEYLNILPDNEKIHELLSIPQAYFEDEALSEQVKVSNASGILSTYIELSSLHSPLADELFSSAEACLSIIEGNCVLSDDSSLSLMEKGSPVSNFLALTTGNALRKWGEYNNAPEYTQAGYALINSVLLGNSLDSITLADAYPILSNNPFYPHYRLLLREKENTVWAWTCAPFFTATNQNNTITLNLQFTKTETNYAIISGINPFAEIEIYGLSFHSDPRFETYNSSGFIYREQKKTLFLKSRHKSETEVVRLSYR